MENCSSMAELKQIQAQMMRKGLIFHVFPVSRIIAFCALSNYGDMNYARLIFDHISNPNVYIWNTMIRGYSRAKNPLMGLSIFRKMVRDGVEMDGRSFVFALKAFGLFSGFERVGQFIVGYVNCARQVFDDCPVKDVVTWTAMIDGYVQRDSPDEALRVFDLMVCGGETVPNEVTMITLLSACALKGDLDLGRRMHCYIEKYDVKYTLNLMNALLDMYVKCGCLMTARRIFEEMECRDVFSWTSMVNGFAKQGELDMARKYFDEMPVKNVVSWNAMIAGYSQNNKPEDALDLFQGMVKGGLVPIEEATLVPVLSACAQSGCLDLGQWIHHHYIHQKRIEFGVSVGNALIDMYAKCGRIDMAEELFHEMPKRDLVSWNSLIIGYADHGNANMALMLFERMKDQCIKPDHITFIGILSACSHAGLVAKGREHFAGMQHKFGLEPKAEHYACMIDLLGRVGLIGEAYDMIRKMPMEPDEAAWGALLNACRMHGYADLGKFAADKLIDLNPEDSGTYVLLANLCATEKRWGEVRNVRSMMRGKGIRKTPGHSFIEVDGDFHEFSAADDSHPRSKEIYKLLKDIFVITNLEEDVVCSNQSIDCLQREDYLFLNNG
uniref:Uncharacterized protein n=1 Tax=Chenopodium quinoa TaxID=63459 RepID=A0A803LTS2_CHEQI